MEGSLYGFLSAAFNARLSSSPDPWMKPEEVEDVSDVGLTSRDMRMSCLPVVHAGAGEPAAPLDVEAESAGLTGALCTLALCPMWLPYIVHTVHERAYCPTKEEPNEDSHSSVWIGGQVSIGSPQGIQECTWLLIFSRRA